VIRNVLFDIGNVLLAFDLAPAIARLNHRPDLSPAAALTLLESHRDPMEAGRTTPGEFLQAIKQEFHCPLPLDEIEAIYADIFTPIHGTWEIARRMAESGLRLALFSNISPIHTTFIRDRYPVFAHFPEAILSYEIGDIKPGPGMYHHATGPLGMIPDQTLYLDDRADNIATGQQFGLHTHLYRSTQHNALLETIGTLGIRL